MTTTENSSFIVLIEDRAEDADRIREALTEVRDALFRLQTIGRMSTALARAAGGGIDLFLLSISCAGEQESDKLANFRRLRTSAPHVPVLLLSEPQDEALALRMIREGAEAYLLKSDGTADNLVHFVRSALERNRNRSQTEKPVVAAGMRASGKVISFAGAKGGVGTTTVALNVAAKLSLESKVILVEAIPSRGFLSQYFRLHGLVISLPDLLVEENPDREKISSSLRPCLAIANLSGLLWPRGAKDSAGRVEITEGLIEALADMADYVIFDLSGSSSQTVQTVMHRSDSTCLVVERELVALNCAKWVLELLQTWGISLDRIGAVVVNRSSWMNPWPLEQVQHHLGLQIVGVIPPALEECIRSFEARSPTVCCEPESMAANSFVALTSYFARHLPAQGPVATQPRSRPVTARLRPLVTA